MPLVDDARSPPDKGEADGLRDGRHAPPNAMPRPNVGPRDLASLHRRPIGLDTSVRVRDTSSRNTASRPDRRARGAPRTWARPACHPRSPRLPRPPRAPGTGVPPATPAGSRGFAEPCGGETSDHYRESGDQDGPKFALWSLMDGKEEAPGWAWCVRRSLTRPCPCLLVHCA